MNDNTQFEPAVLTQGGVRQVLLGVILQPQGVLDTKSIFDLVDLCLETYAWAVREDHLRGIAGAIAKIGKLDASMLESMSKLAKTERVENATRLGEYAAFVCATFNYKFESNPQKSQ